MILLSVESHAHFEKSVESLIKKLTISRDIIVEWLKVQLMLIYHEAVFSGGDIAKLYDTRNKGVRLDQQDDFSSKSND